MITIKFRAWNELYRVMSDPFTLVDALAGKTHGADFTGSELMQFTGLYDVNGKEIYKGDIIKHRYFSMKGIAKVGWNDDEACY